jgi:hypothetical protein
MSENLNEGVKSSRKEPKKPRRIYDWIKYRNIKEATVNNSALVGLRRVNKIISTFIKISFAGMFIGYGLYAMYTNYTEIFEKRIKSIERMIDTEGEDEKKIVYLNNHIKLGLEYGRIQEMDAAEDKTGITHYREKLLKNASGLVLETCK